jgi:hypothetical protein
MNKKFLKSTLAMVLIPCVLFGCADRSELDIHPAKNTTIPQKRVIVFLVDGMRNDIVQSMLKEGELPNFKHYFYDRGCQVENAVSVIPSITYAAIASSITGRFPGHHQIVGNEWFDRISGKFQNYKEFRTFQEVDNDLKAPTLYEMLPDKFTVTIQTAHRRGAARSYDNWMSNGINWHFENFRGVDSVIASRFSEIASCSNSIGTWPDLIFTYFPSLDHIGHHYGSTSKEYRQMLEYVDGQIGRICRGLEKSNLLNGTYLILVSDHGHEDSPNECSWSIEDCFRKELKIPFVNDLFLEGCKPETWQNHLKNYRMVLVNSGPRRIQLYLRSGEFWFSQPSYGEVRNFLKQWYPHSLKKTQGDDLVEFLIKNPSAGIVALKEKENMIRIVGKTGEARVIRTLQPDGVKLYRYETISGDPLNYGDFIQTKKFVNGKSVNSRTWLSASCQTDYPDFVPQIVEFYDAHRSGEITLFAAPGWDFSADSHGGHGSVFRRDMVMPFVIAGPGISKSTIKTARLVDLTPTILELLGCSDRLNRFGNLDGESLYSQIKK